MRSETVAESVAAASIAVSLVITACGVVVLGGWLLASGIVRLT